MDTTLLWSNVIKGLTDLGQYEDAYTALISAPYERLYVSGLHGSRFQPPFAPGTTIANIGPSCRRRDSVSQLLYRMCEENAVERLMALNLAGLADEVEDALAFKARKADPRIRPFYSRILYTWYVSRGDYRNGECPRPRFCSVFGGADRCAAALTMYQRARKLEALMGDASAFAELADLQLEAYAVAMNALALVDSKSQWITLPIVIETGREVGALLHWACLLFLLRYSSSLASAENCQNTSQRISTHWASGTLRWWN